MRSCVGSDVGAAVLVGPAEVTLTEGFADGASEGIERKLGCFVDGNSLIRV